MKKLIILVVILFLTGCSIDTTKNNVKQTPTSAGSNTSSSLQLIDSGSGTTTSDSLGQAVPVVWHDKALEKMVRNKLNKPTGDITNVELNSITELYIWGVTDKKIKSYALTSLDNEYIDESGQNYSDLGEIVSIEDLKLFINLKNLTLCHQNIADFSPLKSLIKLDTLVLTGNGITDLTFIKPLSKLKTLIVDYNNISSFDAINDIDSLEYINLSYNEISALTGIQDCKGLKTLIIDQENRRPKNFARINDIGQLEKLTNLENLSLENQEVEDLTPLTGLLNLKSINIQDTKAWDFSPLKNLKKLQTLKIKNYYIDNNLAFLRNLPELKDTDLSEDDWKKINYPFKLSEADAVEGIYAGNIVNGGVAGFDGKNIYYEDIVYGDLGHPNLVQFDNDSYIIKSISGQITEQMGKIIGQEPGGMIDESISFLNIYKGRLFFIGDGNNNDTADALPDGSYDPGVEVSGLFRMNLDGSDRVILTKDQCSYVCVVNGRIYCLNKDGYPISMNLDGKDTQLLLKKACKMLYSDGKQVYYQLNDSNNYLYTMNMDGTQSTVLLKTSCNKPIMLSDGIYYLNERGSICTYSFGQHQQNVLNNCKADYFNLNQQYIYYSNKDGIYRIDRYGQSPKQIYVGQAGTLNVIGDYIFFSSDYGYCKIKNDGSEYTEYFTFF